MNNSRKHLRNIVPLVLAVGLAACASSPEIDPRRIQQAQIAIEEAKEVNAGRHAAGTLARAEERLNMARRAIDDGDEQRARFLLDESVALAQLAEAQALERDSELALAQIRENLNVLERELR